MRDPSFTWTYALLCVWPGAWLGLIDTLTLILTLGWWGSNLSLSYMFWYLSKEVN